MLQDAREFALEAHGAQKYGNKPYSYHLDAVAGLLESYGETAQAVAYLHDVIEDTPITYQQVVERFDNFIADCVQILTDEDGDNRKERKQKTYAKMAAVEGELQLALIVKAADRLANILACVELQVPEKLEMYQKEHEQFTRAVYRSDLCEELWDRIGQALGSV